MANTDSDRTTIEDLIHDLGNCGLFQIFMVTAVHGAVMISNSAFIFMAFGNYNPGWHCNDTQHITTPFPLNTSAGYYFDFDPANYTNESVQLSGTCSDHYHCDNIVYNGDVSTIVTEWDLICSKDWINSLIISCQMIGFIIGSSIAGVFNNLIGRKPTHFCGLALNIVFHVIAVFSVNWPMFMVIRFFIGLTSGSIDVTNTVFSMEIITNKWRAVVSALPFSCSSSVLFGVAAYIQRDWRALHLTLAVASAIFLIPVLCVPESIRWLAIKGHTDKAAKVVQKIADINGKKCPPSADVIHKIAEHEKASETSYTSDLYRHGYAARTFILNWSQSCVLVSYSFVKFNIRGLFGDFYLNFILMGAIPMVSILFVPYLINILGRRNGCLILVGIGCICWFTMIFLDTLAAGDVKGIGTLVLFIILDFIAAAQWSVTILGCTEMYPTSLRSLATGHVAVVSRTVGVLAPFLIPYDEDMALVSHIILACSVCINFVLVFFLPETKDKHLTDYIDMDEA